MSTATNEHNATGQAIPPVRNTTVLVTGGSGFLAGWLIIELLQHGYRVRTTVRDRAREARLRDALTPVVGSADRLSVLEADLLADKGWSDAVDGTDYVLHVASPFPAAQPRNPDEVIVPARNGTLRVLRASLAAGVRRVVLTSSTVAVGAGQPANPTRPLTERDWTDPTSPRVTPYERSKTIAEHAAWELARDANALDRLTVINPDTILGPVLDDHRSTSVQVIERMLNGMPAVPRLGYSFVDARDVAALQATAMIAPAAAGQRFLATGTFLWLSDIATILREQLGPAVGNVPHHTLPNWMARVIARFDPSLRSIIDELGQQTTYSSKKAQQLLGWAPRPIEQTILDTAHSLRSTISTPGGGAGLSAKRLSPPPMAA